LAKIRKSYRRQKITIVELISAHLRPRLRGGGSTAAGTRPPRRTTTDAILLDLMMPGLDGQRLTRFLKQDPLYSAIPIVILTGIASEDEGTILAFGADAYIAKGRIENTMANILETFAWLEGRSDPGEKRSAVLGVDNLYPREMTRELLHIKGHLDTMLALMGEGVIEIDQDHRILYANPAACRVLDEADHRLFGKSLPGFFPEAAGIAAYLASVPCGTQGSPPPLQFEHGQRTMRISFSTLLDDSNFCGSIVLLEDVSAQVLCVA
jgi:CheY-like chemotaxis protein